MSSIMREYMNETMKNKPAATKLMNQQQKQGESILKAVPRGK